MLFEHTAKRVTMNVDRRVGFSPSISALRKEPGGTSPTLHKDGNVRSGIGFVHVMLEDVP